VIWCGINEHPTELACPGTVLRKVYSYRKSGALKIEFPSSNDELIINK
jgi:hypothetical protein